MKGMVPALSVESASRSSDREAIKAEVRKVSPAFFLHHVFHRERGKAVPQTVQVFLRFCLHGLDGIIQC